MKTVKNNLFDLVITDIVMPEKEGIETIHGLKKHNADLAIIAISGGGRIHPGGYLEMAKMFGANATFEKPIEKNKLIDMVKYILEQDDDIA